MTIWNQAREAINEWKQQLENDPFTLNTDFQHSLKVYFPEQAPLTKALSIYAAKVPLMIELANENDFRTNLPRLEHYSGSGTQIDKVIHHPNYHALGELIYNSGMMALIAKPGRLLESLCYFFLSSHAGEAGHHCPIACSAGIIRILTQVELPIPEKEHYLKKLCHPNFKKNYTGAQFITEIQGGSDVGQNGCQAKPIDNNYYQIYGEKWFCSNVDADLILMTARLGGKNSQGTGDLGLFLVSRYLDKGQLNHFKTRRLKEKLGTRSMASGEIDFEGAIGTLIGDAHSSFKYLMTHVLHLSRIYNSFACLGLSTQAWHIAYQYARQRKAFGKRIIEYPLIQQNLATQRAENCAMLAFIMQITSFQDQIDSHNDHIKDEWHLLLRTLVNLAKFVTAQKTVAHVRQSIEVLGGNGAIESFSILPRLLRDSIVYENWEGTHNTLFMQILRDSHKYDVDNLCFKHLKEKLASLPQNNSTDFLLNQVHQLKQSMVMLKNQNESQQQYEIKKQLILMSHLAICTSLLFEATKTSELISKAKVDMVELLIWKYFKKTQPPLALAQRVCCAVE